MGVKTDGASISATLKGHGRGSEGATRKLPTKTSLSGERALAQRCARAAGRGTTERNSAVMALRSAALVVALFGAPASGQHHHGMDPFAGSSCTCATFCDGSCDIEDVGQKTMELFRMTQFGVVGTLGAHE